MLRTSEIRSFHCFESRDVDLAALMQRLQIRFRAFSLGLTEISLSVSILCFRCSRNHRGGRVNSLPYLVGCVHGYGGG